MPREPEARSESREETECHSVHVCTLISSTVFKNKTQPRNQNQCKRKHRERFFKKNQATQTESISAEPKFVRTFFL